jgi:hypothetical protein
MMDTVACSNCGYDNAYHNGVCYECPDCDYQWGDKLTFNQDVFEDDISDAMGSPETEALFNELIRLKEPFFRLKQGALYRCSIKRGSKVYKQTIIPLTFGPKNYQFILIDAERRLAEVPTAVEKIIAMSSDQLLNEEAAKADPKNPDLVDICTTTEENKLMNIFGHTFYDFEWIGK